MDEGILRWDQRVNWASTEPASKLVVAAMKEEIDDLRSAYAGMTADRGRWEKAYNDVVSMVKDAEEK